MRTLILSACAALALTGAVWAQDMKNPAIEDTIQSQIDAFLMDDFATAFTFASPGIQSYFRNPDNFGMMVRQGYPMVWRPDQVEFLDLRDVDGRLWQKVLVRDRSGKFHVLDYRMIELDGQWRIDGVQVLPAPNVAA